MAAIQSDDSNDYGPDFASRLALSCNDTDTDAGGSSVPAVPTRVSLEEAIIAALDEPARPGEPAAAAFQRKELALREVFAALSVADARTLHHRLAIPIPGDPIEQRFSRLIADRKARLMAFLADARRRAATRPRR